MRRFLLKAVAVIALLLAVASAGGYHYLRRSLPQIDGSVTVAGLSAPVDIIRDADAIPHVFAANKRDALFGLGYVHAQDRLWQMELQRRIGFGRLSEVLGPAALPQDRFLRTIGFGRAANTAWASTPDWARQQIDAYVAGVNAFISTHRGAGLPPEFTLLGFEPAPWSGADVIVWVKMMAWDLSANYAFELLRHDLVNVVGAERMAQLMPPYAVGGLSIIDRDGGGDTGQAAATAGPGVRRVSQAHAAQPPFAAAEIGSSSWSHAFARSLSSGDASVRDILFGGASAEALGSNNWVVDGTLTASGKPLLANDPHLSARLPSTWYLAHVAGGEFEIIGATLPGAPAVALGRNRSIAWGATNVAADVEDLYRERLDATGRFAEFRGAQEPITVIRETITVKGGPTIAIDVRVTRHGPLVSDAINAMNAEAKTTPKAPPVEPLAFRWTALDPGDTTVASFLKLNEARNWTEFTAALRDFVTPSQNFVYADVDGHIGYYAPGRIPIRASGDGSLPADGSSGAAEWAGWVPFDALPHIYDPPDHVIVTANHRPAPPSYPYLLGLEWPEPYRAQRIVELLAAGGRRPDHRFTPDDFARIQADTVSLHSRTLLPLLLARVRAHEMPDRQAVEMLRGWDGDAVASSPAAAIFAAWFHQLAPAIVGDDLGPLLTDRYKERYSFVTRFVVHALQTNDASWCDDRSTAAIETCDDIVTIALRRAVADLEQRLGSDMTRWRWDAVHSAVFPHQGLDAVAALRPLLSRSVPNGGDWSTVNVGPVDALHPYEQHSLPGYREIIDLSPANDSRFIDAVGESGHFLSKHYADFLDDWQAVRHKKMRMSRQDAEAGATGRLRLTP